MLLLQVHIQKGDTNPQDLLLKIQKPEIIEREKESGKYVFIAWSSKLGEVEARPL